MTQRVAIAGFGAIGKVVAQHLDRGIEGLALAAVSARDTARAAAAIAGFARPVPVLPLARLGEEADIVVECAPAAVLRDIAEPALAHGRLVLVLSCGALLDNFDLVDLARRHGGRILVPSGALLGLERGGGIGARRDRSGSHDDRDLGRSKPDAQCSSHRGRSQSSPPIDAHRECAVARKSAHRAAYRTLGHRRAQEIVGPPRDRDLTRHRDICIAHR